MKQRVMLRRQRRLRDISAVVIGLVTALALIVIPDSAYSRVVNS
jgi:hypothetical protein